MILKKRIRDGIILAGVFIMAVLVFSYLTNMLLLMVKLRIELKNFVIKLMLNVLFAMTWLLPRN